ncbi:uncharacterized protein EI90DRAFT_2970988 [Cantharellus anzutake]|uniref:uncharacterized protein n=1 Tax=Cantharellus anzutake TaxID=1750568 RepID=UPI00190567AD|nr:uncharacterized protein EI90DRAFT_2970988 [Cantharellus anzutake]KAF8333534.1 hypothetical protein EI90DRAFT_2970988 [Cantharellus anzutake]
MFLPLATPSPPTSSRPSYRQALPSPTGSSLPSKPLKSHAQHHEILPLLDQHHPRIPFRTFDCLDEDHLTNKHPSRRRRDLPSRANCSPADNSQLSCLPTQNQQVIQNQWFTFEWSTGNPLFNQVTDVDIYLLSANSDQTLAHWTLPKQQGTLQVLANDTFWGTQGLSIQSGQNQSYPFNFVILPTTATLHFGERTEPTFTGIQTALPNSALLSLSSVSSVQSTRSVQSSQSVASTSSIFFQSSVSTQSVHASNTGSEFPHWATALLAVFGSLAVLALLAFSYMLLRKMRRKQDLAKRNSTGSRSPMIAAPTSPMSVGQPEAGGGVGPAPGGSLVGAAFGAGAVQRDSSVRGPATDGGSMVSSEPGLISTADAQILGDAFRQAMRSIGPLEEGDNGQLLNRELAEEGRDIRSVSSARDVRVEGSSAQQQ